MIVDAHVHTWPGQPDLDPHLLEAADRLGVERLCVSSLGRWQYVPTLADCVEANRQVEDLVRRHPDRVWGYCYLNPSAPPIRRDDAVLGWKDEMNRCLDDAGMIGVKLWVSQRCTDPSARAVVEHAIEKDVVVLQHTWWKATGNLAHESRPEDGAELSRLYPQAKLIFAHLGGDWQRGVAAWRDTNACTDTSGSIVERGALERAVECLGAHRIVFGSDGAGAALAGQLAKVTGAAITEQHKRMILSENFLRLISRC